MPAIDSGHAATIAVFPCEDLCSDPLPCAGRAGLMRFVILPIDNELFRFYRLRDEL